MDKLDKVMITVEQEKALKEFLKNRSSNVDAMETFLKKRTWWEGIYKPLKDIPANDFIKILSGWYEVEQEFKVGDWVKWTYEQEEYLKILKIKDDSIHFVDGTYIDESCLRGDISKIEKVIEQWKIILLELGRRKPVFVEGDMCIAEDDCYYRFWDEKSACRFYELFEENKIKYFYPVETRININNAK